MITGNETADHVRIALEAASKARQQCDPTRQPLEPTTERLLRFERACEEIWPAINFFGLCGASPAYITAMAEIGDLLGKFPKNAPVDAGALILAAKQEAKEQIADIVASDPAFRGQIGRSLALDFAGRIRNLNVSAE